ncbi:hypothetical protein EDEG_02320 [Edhazardia aedis USNM 41457]|uniref:Uncharacterized protein n=1 Tax=Edhazardia aedis (strain USNM 41457) TaxID=1003232 RepID=J8ZUI9_EDHAE|nr:hypothetical protein EDEG_02320 [Edhazardia aedis USNM 41457]|eukprot:EJW03343.1 hypothetical protein EDEG_02320 [Edhazardia aedis USNM 41457]
MFCSMCLNFFYLLSTLKAAEYIHSENIVTNQHFVKNEYQTQSDTEILTHTIQNNNKKYLTSPDIRYKEHRKYDFIKNLCKFNELFYCLTLYSTSPHDEDRRKTKNYSFEIDICFEFMKVNAYTYIFTSNELNNVDSDYSLLKDIMLKHKNEFSAYFSFIQGLNKQNTSDNVFIINF